MMDGKTHWEGCWREHLDCAVARVEELESSPQRLAAPFRVGSVIIGRGCKVSTAQLAVDRFVKAHGKSLEAKDYPCS